jgi:hypothetical protein
MGPNALTISSPIIPFSAARIGYSAMRPAWLQLKTETVPIPYSLAFFMASSIAIFAATWP